MSKTVLEMARETGYIVYDGHSGVDITFNEDGLKRFAALICEAERERCATQVDHILKSGGGTYGDYLRSMK